VCPWTCWGYGFVAVEVRKTAEAADAETVLDRHSKKRVGDALVAFPQDEALKEVGSNYSLLVLGSMVHETYSVA
jgi:hypothetical protein